MSAAQRSPRSSQGTSLALVGAYVLAEELRKAADDYRAAFMRYEERMRPYVILNQGVARGSQRTGLHGQLRTGPGRGSRSTADECRAGKGFRRWKTSRYEPGHSGTTMTGRAMRDAKRHPSGVNWNSSENSSNRVPAAGLNFFTPSEGSKEWIDRL